LQKVNSDGVYSGKMKVVGILRLNSSGQGVAHGELIGLQNGAVS
jgi:hypothetical protein